MIDLAVPGAPANQGLRFRRYRGEEDLPAMLRVLMAVHRHDGLEEVITLDQIRLNYATLVNCDPSRDLILAEVDGEPVAYARVFWNDLVEGGRSYENFGFVDPAWRRRGIGSAMHRPDNADPALWRIGWAGDEVAGVVTTIVQAEENEEFGRARVYVAGVSVRRPWRRRGLARALLARSLVAAREAGYTSASLGVDTDSPTGATALYTSLGFVPEKTFTSYRKPL